MANLDGGGRRAPNFFSPILRASGGRRTSTDIFLPMTRAGGGRTSTKKIILPMSRAGGGRRAPIFFSNPNSSLLSSLPPQLAIFPYISSLTSRNTQTQLQTNVSIKEQDYLRLMATNNFKEVLSVQYKDYDRDGLELWAQIEKTVLVEKQPLVITGCHKHESWKEGLFDIEGIRKVFRKDPKGNTSFICHPHCSVYSS